PIDEGCECPACKHYTRSYIRHLFKAKEMLALRLCVLHNLYFYNKLMEDIRKALDEDRFHEFKENKLSEWSRGQEPVEN
ncbi:MAG: tRNA-guanine transglycosylase, partial [Proteiniclasticum sp.]|nr:tRNA-guanine transglycosylase [Proteiniclasticum sp.]